MTTQVSEPVYCPACDRSFSSMDKLRAHIKRGQAEGDDIHIDIADLEGWDETSTGVNVNSASDLEPT